MPDIMHVVKIHASPEQVYEALTTDEGIRNWWTRDAVLDSAIGGVGEFGFFNRRVVTKVKIDELKPPIRVAWTTISSAAPGGWDDTRITFDLRPEAGDTVLCFAHRGFKQADEGYARTTTGWGYYLVSLQQYLEAGKGAPHPDVDFARVIDRPDFRMPTASKWRAPRAVADGGGGTIIATAEVGAPPERVFRALTTNEVERWWGHPEFYRQTEWTADLRVCGQWSVTVRFASGDINHGSGEFVEIDAPHKLVMTRKFEKHPLLGTRETTITYRLDPLGTGTRVTVRDEGFVGRSEAAYGNADHWERVLGWLGAYVKS